MVVSASGHHRLSPFRRRLRIAWHYGSFGKSQPTAILPDLPAFQYEVSDSPRLSLIYPYSVADLAFGKLALDERVKVKRAYAYNVGQLELPHLRAGPMEKVDQFPPNTKPQ